MNFRHEGNGHSQIKVHITLVAHGYIIVHADDITTPSVDTSVAVSQTVEKVLKDKPTMRVRSTLPIVKEGHTVAVHIWFDE